MARRAILTVLVALATGGAPLGAATGESTRESAGSPSAAGPRASAAAPSTEATAAADKSAPGPGVARDGETKPAAKAPASAGAGGSGAPATRAEVPGDSGFTIPAGQEGTVFRSLTVEGEDRVHFDFERPALYLDLDPTKAPGLDWGTAGDVLNRTVPDFSTPLVKTSSRPATPYLAHPWLSRFATGAVARFRPDLKGVERWKLTVVDARGEMVAAFEGKGEPPREIAWDGRLKGGGIVTPGRTYSYVMEARDKAGNKRNFVGQGFQVTAYRLPSIESPVMVFSGRELPAPDPTRPASSPAEREAAAPILVEAASWLNQSPKQGQPVTVTATARTLEQAQTLCALVVRQMTPYLLGDPGRLRAVPEVEPDAPEGGAVTIALAR